jgi:hypothetical protein
MIRKSTFFVALAAHPTTTNALRTLICITILIGSLASCTTTVTPGYQVTGRAGRNVAQLSTAEQQQLAQDLSRCQQANVVTISGDPTAAAALAGAAASVLATHGNAAARTQAALQGASNSADQANTSLQPVYNDVAIAAEWKVSDCLKAAGWDSVPRFMTNGGVP